ncbi:MAG: SH3 domain-containing protein [Desulfobacteraceae bacterium]
MQRKYVLWMMSLLFLTACPLSSWASADEGDAGWRGRITVRVNVREAPGEESSIITQIDQGERVTVNRVRNGWCQVSVKGDTFQFMGWVYGKYVAPVTGKESKEPKTPLSRSSAVSPDRGVLSKMPGGDEGHDPIRHSPEEPGAAKGPILSVNPPEAKASPSQRAEEKSASERADVLKKGNGVKSTLKKPASGEKVSSDKGPAEQAPREVENARVTRQEPLPAASESHGEQFKTEKSGGPEKGLDLRAQRIVPPVQAGEKRTVDETPAAAALHAQSGQGYGMVTGVIIKLMVVAFSCLAILLAHRAILMVETRRQ